MGKVRVVVVEVQLEMFWTGAWPEGMHVMVDGVVRPESVHTRLHVCVVFVEADAKGCEGEVAVEEPYVLPKMSRVCIHAGPKPH